MKHPYYFGWSLVIAAWGLTAGCAGRQASQEVARLTLRQTVQLEDQLADKLRAETEYYKKRREGLVTAAQDGLALDLSNYLRVQADASAERVATMPVSEPVQVSQVRLLLKEMLLEWDSQRTGELKNIEELTTAMRRAVQALSTKSMELAKLREKIEPLQEREKPVAIAQELFKFYQSLEKELSKPEAGDSAK